MSNFNPIRRKQRWLASTKRRLSKRVREMAAQLQRIMEAKTK